MSSLLSRRDLSFAIQQCSFIRKYAAIRQCYIRCINFQYLAAIAMRIAAFIIILSLLLCCERMEMKKDLHAHF
jgi:hypothetical protein